MIAMIIEKINQKKGYTENMATTVFSFYTSSAKPNIGLVGVLVADKAFMFTDVKRWLRQSQI